MIEQVHGLKLLIGERRLEIAQALLIQERLFIVEVTD
jgi:hypothetical protein